jgi:hypothetical protein
MKIQLKNTIVILLAISILNGCKKGEDGKDGADGQNGAANLIAYTYSISSWLYSSPAWYKNLSVPELTPDNINSASVQVYFYSATNTWKALPFTQYNSGAADYLMGFETTINIVKITWIYDSSLSSGSDPNAYFGTTCQFKVVLIPPAMIVSHPDVDLKNYEEVKKAFDLKD